MVTFVYVFQWELFDLHASHAPENQKSLGEKWPKDRVGYAKLM